MVILAMGMHGYGQFYNKEYYAKILARNDSEFYTFAATAENLTPTNVNLKYDFSVYSTDENNNVARTQQSDLFYIKGNERLVLSTTTVNYNATGKISVVLVLYDIDGKPVGQDRIDLISENGHQTISLNNETAREVRNEDQAEPQDGFVIGGLVIENTITKAGRDFYKYFYSEYYNKGVQTKKNIVIKEVPGKMRTTRVSVKIDDQLVWQFFSQPKKSFLKEMANTALDRCISYLQQLQQQTDNGITRY